MAQVFQKAVDAMVPLYETLMSQPLVPLHDKKSFPDKGGVYLICEDDTPLYTGRCKSIRKRMANHGGRSPQSSTFAFRLACAAIEHKVTYKAGKGRKELMQNPSFCQHFESNVERIRNMNVRYVVITDDVTQHLFEVYVHLALETPHNSFATH